MLALATGWAQADDLPDFCPYPPSAAKAPADACERPFGPLVTVRQVLACAGQLPDQVAALRAGFESLPEVINKAAKAALMLDVSKAEGKTPTAVNKARAKALATGVWSSAPASRSVPGQDVTHANLLECATGMQERARVATEALDALEEKSKAYVAGALALKAAAGDAQTALSGAVRLHDELVKALAEVRDRDAALRELALRLEVGTEWTGVDAVQALRFARLLRDDPDASALVGEDAFSISASTADTTAALRLASRVNFAGGLRRMRLNVSTPLNEDDSRTALYERADGLAGKLLVTAGIDNFWGRWESTLMQFGVALSVGYDRRTYLEDGVAPAEKTESVVPFGATATATFYDATPDSRSTHRFELGWQQTHDDGDEVTRCPVPGAGALFVDCLTGALGAPTRVRAAVLSYQWRRAWDAVAVAPKLSMNSRSRVVELDVPVYLVRSADSKDRPFNAGISLGVASRGKTEITERTGRVIRFGVFVGAPFSMLD